MKKYKCTVCKGRNIANDTILLSENELGLSSVKEYYACKWCYECLYGDDFEHTT